MPAVFDEAVAVTVTVPGNRLVVVAEIPFDSLIITNEASVIDDAISGVLFSC